MLTLRFESDNSYIMHTCDHYVVSREDDLTLVVMYQYADEEKYYKELIGSVDDNYARCYVMNDQGNTVDTIIHDHL